MSQDSSTEGLVETDIMELRLRPGMEIKLLDSKGNMLAHKAQFIAIFSGKSILISMLVDDSRKVSLHAGDTYLIKGFTGKYDFSFSASVLQVDGAQFNARLSYPQTVTVKFVRSHLRVKLDLSINAPLPEQNTPSTITVTDLSIGGAGIASTTPLGSIGKRIHLTLPVEFEKKKMDLNLDSEIRHITETESGLKTGVEFVDVSQHDKLLLHYLVNSLSENVAII